MAGHLLIRSDARRLPLADESIHCVITSPPYYGLRDYRTGRWEGGDEMCDHRSPTMRAGRNEDRPKLAGSDSTNAAQLLLAARSACGKCGARRVDRQLGLEPSPDAYVAAMVAVFREIRRVLRSDGTAWVNMGDSYNSSPSNQQDGAAMLAKGGAAYAKYGTIGRQRRDCPGLKPKDLIGMPWRLALALQADGWYLRSSIVWSKAEVGEDDELEGSTMPGSQRDRPTSAHELIFLLSKSARYYYDPEACKTKSGAMLRDVWRMNPEAFPGAHFATFPRELPRRAILLGTSERGVCPRCGKPWTRVVERGELISIANPKLLIGRKHRGDANRNPATRTDQVPYKASYPTTTIGWRPGCTCDAGEPIPATVLDPFVGSGTTIIVANALGRRAIGLDLSAEYLAMARRRIARPHARAERPARAAEVHPLFDRNPTEEAPCASS